MIEHLPVLQVLVPLMAAPICALVPHKRAAWLIALAAVFCSLGISLSLIQQVQLEGVLSYAIGNWVGPIGIELRVDAANSFMATIISAVASVVMISAPWSLERELPGDDRHHLIFATLLLCMTGLMGITVTGDAFNVFVFLEVSSLSTYALISLGRDRRALSASFQYLIMGTIGGTFILIGIGLMYMMTGTLNMADLVQRLPAVMDTSTVRAALAFLTVGLSIKLAVFPLHLWLPNAYTYAPSVVTSFLSATATKVSFYVLARIVFVFFGADMMFGDLGLNEILIVLALVGIYSASLVAIFQTNLKRLLAWSSVAQVGYMVLGLSMGSESGLTAGFVHLFNHAMMKGGAFLAVGCMLYRLGSCQIDDLNGLLKRMPWTTGAFVICGLSLIGVPGTAGFISKWYLILAALEQGMVWVAAAALISSLLAVLYVWKVVEVIWLRPPPEGSGREEAPLIMLVPAWIMAIGTIYFGLIAEDSAGLAAEAARQLLGVSS